MWPESDTDADIRIVYPAALRGVLEQPEDPDVCRSVDGDVRFCVDGTTPTSSKGLRLTQDSNVEVWGAGALTNFRCIDDGGTAKLEVVYMGRGTT